MKLLNNIRKYRNAIAKRTIRKIIKFNPEKYWTKRGKVYYNWYNGLSEMEKRGYLANEKLLLGALKTLEFKSILEVGCGFGRILKLVNNNFELEKIVGIDLSNDQIENAKNYIGDKKVELHQGSIYKLDFPDRSFDLVFTSEVLMHVPPDKIREAMKELLRVSKRHVLNMEFFKKDFKGNLAEHNWTHDYPRIYKEIGHNVKKSVKIEDDQTIFLVEKN
ncbi:MAG: class I SAM-dependent methyltransferase [Candidatus Aenigmarchaeota archaeon]|nr:class I SAM-dependent methyltransferase [Candidatus Aenigmarchaeota archaeon]